MPELVFQTLEQMNKYHQQQVLRDKQTQQMREQMKALSQKAYAGFFGAVLIFSSSMFAAASLQTSFNLSTIPMLSWLLAGVGLAIMIYTWPRVNRS